MPTTPNLGWNPLVTGVTGAGVRNAEPPFAMALRRAARRLNTAATRGRIVFSQHVPLADAPSAALATDAYRFRLYQRNLNGTRLVYVATFAPKNETVNTNAGIMRETGTDLITSDYMNAAPAAPADLTTAIASVTETPGGAEASRLIRVVDGFRLLSLTVFERPDDAYPFRLSGTNHHVDESPLFPGAPVAQDTLADLRETTDELWNRVRDCWGYCSHGFNSVAIGNDGYTATTTTFTNFLDATTARLATTAGIPTSVLHGGKGFATSVNAHCAVYAERTGGAGSTGEVRFTSSLNSVDITTIGAAGWYASSNTLQLDTRTSNGDVRDWDKVDVLGRISAADGAMLRVWAIHVEVDP